MSDMKSSLRTLKKRQERKLSGGNSTKSRRSTEKSNEKEKTSHQQESQKGDAAPVLSDEELSRRWGEVEFLLRTPLKTDAEILAAEEAAAQGLKFIDDLSRYSVEMDENRGMLLRWVLPFDATTSIADQSNIEASGTYEGAGTGSAITPEQNEKFSAHIDETMKADLLSGALALRQLVRVKLSDEADLKQGLSAVQVTHTFLHELCRAANNNKMSQIALLQRL